VGRYVALLRGINVGGNNLIKMSALKACFEAQGFTDVSTFIASGNVLFSATGSAPALTARIETALSAEFGYRATVMVRSAAELKKVVGKAPRGFGKSAKYRYDVAFVRKPTTPSRAVKVLPRREGVDQIWAGPGVIYFSRLVARASQSKMAQVITLPLYKDLTIRNWNTTSALARLSAEGPSA
jgi:uncharacterized protein (DUF1697 family)